VNKISALVSECFGNESHGSPFVTMSFRCSDETQLKISLLSTQLGYSSKSKFLNELVEAAISDVVEQLPEGEGQTFDQQFEDELHIMRQMSL
jgi:hypothetical protein